MFLGVVFFRELSRSDSLVPGWLLRQVVNSPPVSVYSVVVVIPAALFIASIGVTSPSMRSKICVSGLFLDPVITMECGSINGWFFVLVGCL